MKAPNLLLLILIFAVNTLFAQQLTYKLANPRIVHVGSPGYDNFEFDLQVKASTAGTYFWAGQWQFVFDNSALSVVPFTAQWSMTMAPAFSALNSAGVAKYAMASKNFIGSGTVEFYFSISGDGNPLPIGLAGGNGGGPTDDWVELTTVYQPLCTVRARITGATGVAGLSFHESISNGQQQYVSGPNAVGFYTNPCLFDVANFTTTYLGRIYANSSWSQSGGSTAGTYLNWATAVNTSVYDGAATIPATGVSSASAVRIHTGATLTIPTTGQLTAASIDNNTANGLTIVSDGTSTGSLITGPLTGSGTTSLQRFMNSTRWYMLSSPVSQQITGFLANNAAIPTNGTNERGMMDYATITNSWSPYFTSATTGNTDAGKGFLVRTTSDAAVTFTGTLNAGSTSVPVSRSVVGGNIMGWNLVGNPFSSAVDVDNFLTTNTGALDVNYVSIYVWDESYSKIQYKVLNQSNHDIAAVGQGFMVKPGVDGSSNIQFTPAMQLHAGATVLKSGKSATPEIKLIAVNNGKNVSTSIKFLAGTSKGLDVGYDAGLLKLDPTIALYTRLVEDNGINFAIQCLPTNDLSSLIIPVGIDSKIGGEVVFSVEGINLSPDCKVILEDKLSKTFTDLSNNDYTTTITANSVTSDRFFIHTSNQITGIDGETLPNKLSAYAIKNTEIRVKGNVSNQAVATLYDIQGRVVVVKRMEEGSMNIIPTPNIRSGIYMLSVKDNNKVQGFKILVKE